MFTKAEYPFNQPYDEAYMSVFQFGGNKYFAEHNIPLSSDEIGKIVGFVSGALAKMDDGALEQKWGELLKLKNQVQVEQHKKEPHTRRGYPWSDPKKLDNIWKQTLFKQPKGLVVCE